jgi:hypothetical protein
MENTKLLTVADLFQFAKEQAKIDTNNYRDRKDYNSDRSRRDRQRAKCLKRFGFMRNSLLPHGHVTVGRLTAGLDGIDYTVGQYAPTEIWAAVYDWLSGASGMDTRWE